jgi:hypothetical protein
MKEWKDSEGCVQDRKITDYQYVVERTRIVSCYTVVLTLDVESASDSE